MKPISYVITNFIEQTVSEKGLNLYITADGKYLAMDSEFDTILKFDLIFSDSDFSCQILARGSEGLMLRRSFNIPWTSGGALREFMTYVKEL